MNIKKLTLTAFFAAIAVAGSLFSFPVLGSRCSPIQHLVNVMCAILLGPWYGLAAAFLAALIRNILGLGTLLAFPGSMCGALLSGLLYKWMKKLPAAYIGEVVGTGIIGGMLSYPIAAVLMGSFIHLCCTISDQYCWRHDHGHRDHNDNEENKGAGKVSAADQQLTGNIAGHSYRCCAWGQCIGAGCLALYICGGRYIDDTCVGGENTGCLIVAVV